MDLTCFTQRCDRALARATISAPSPLPADSMIVKEPGPEAEAVDALMDAWKAKPKNDIDCERKRLVGDICPTMLTHNHAQACMLL